MKSYTIIHSKRFKKQIKKLARSGRLDTLKKLEKVVGLLANKHTLSENYQNHMLSGTLEGIWECHVAPDWLLLYKKFDDILVLELISTGTHSKLFE